MASDLDTMAALGDQLRQEYEAGGVNRWAGSRFEWLVHQAPPRKGAIGKRMFRRWATGVDLNVSAAPPRSGFDCRVEGLAVAIKFGRIWDNGDLVFEQIRNGNYDAVALLGLEPSDVNLWIVPLDVLWENSDQQHGRETHWLRFSPDAVPEFLLEYGGTLERARLALLEQAQGA